MPLPPAPTRKAALLTNEAYKNHAPSSRELDDEVVTQVAAPAPVTAEAAPAPKPSRTRRTLFSFRVETNKSPFQCGKRSPV